jgi:hypothetical protein
MPIFNARGDCTMVVAVTPGNAVIKGTAVGTTIPDSSVFSGTSNVAGIVAKGAFGDGLRNTQAIRKPKYPMAKTIMTNPAIRIRCTPSNTPRLINDISPQATLLPRQKCQRIPQKIVIADFKMQMSPC